MAPKLVDTRTPLQRWTDHARAYALKIKELEKANEQLRAELSDARQSASGEYVKEQRALDELLLQEPSSEEFVVLLNKHRDVREVLIQKENEVERLKRAEDLNNRTIEFLRNQLRSDPRPKDN